MTTDANDAKRKPLTQKEKALAEKAIKLRFNHLINCLTNTPSQEEREPLIPLIALPSEYGNTGLSLLVRKWDDPSFDRHSKTENFPNSALAMMPDLIKAKQAIDAAEEAYEKQEKLFFNCFHEVNDSIRKDNEVIEARCKAARARRMEMVQQLKTERDQMILTVAFDGEDRASAFLAGLPSVASVTDTLAGMGLSLTQALPEATGIGDGPIPTNLRSGESVKVKVSASIDDDD